MTRTALMAVAIGALLQLCAVRVASAQAGVVVLRLEPSAEPLCVAVEQALAGMPLFADPGYAAEAARRRLVASSEQAFGQLVPPIGAALVVVPFGADPSRIYVAFRDGRSGAPLGQITVPLEGGALGRNGVQQLVAEVQRRLGKPPAGAPATANVVPQGEPATAASTEQAAPGEAESDQTAQAGGVALQADLSLGAGLGTRETRWPTSLNDDVVALGAFPAVALEAGVTMLPSPGVAFGPRFVYQTSIAHEVSENHVAGEPRPLPIRAHRFEVTVVPELRFGDTRALRLAFALGVAIRNLRPEVHYLKTPGFSLAGPVARIVLRIPLSGDVAALSLGPEVQWIAAVGKELKDYDVNGSGVSVGGEVGVELVLAAPLSAVLRYREAHALLGSRLGGSASDVERFLTLGVRWELGR